MSKEKLICIDTYQDNGDCGWDSTKSYLYLSDIRSFTPLIHNRGMCTLNTKYTSYIIGYFQQRDLIEKLRQLELSIE